ncbi:TPA_asm: protein 3 [Frullania virus 1]|uniref:Protein 3 n=1 Tax=Frullania virus 1 TaxID=2977968 RepID=A0A9N7AB30_9RHAB|nr:TPA_asm: protein 3 [Frullania virus 1]
MSLSKNKSVRSNMGALGSYMAEADGQLYDPEAQSEVPRKRVVYNSNWDFSLTGEHRVFDLGRQPIMKSAMANLKGNTTLCDPEIHVVWRSFVPPRLCQDPVTISLNFTQREDQEDCLMHSHSHPMHLFFHHIFYPEHSIRLGPKEVIPWSLCFEVDSPNFSQDYKLAEVRVKLVGYEDKVAKYGEGRESQLISLVPSDESVQGVRMSKPRLVTNDWEIGGFRVGTSNKKDMKKVLFLQSLGVDVEGFRIAKKLKSVLKLISDNDIKAVNDPVAQKAIVKRVSNSLKSVL